MEHNLFGLLVGSCDEILINVNDTFYAAGDCEKVPMYAIERIENLLVQYGHDALVALVAVKRGIDPMDCRCNHKNENYWKAKAEIEKLLIETPDLWEY